MRITGIVASPKKTGNSDILVKHALKAAAESGAEVRILRLYDFQIEYCRGCEKCITGENRECQIKDDVRFIYQQIKQSDGLIVGSPIYIHSIPGILKTLIDRMRPYVERGESNHMKVASFIFTHTFASQFEHIYALPNLLFFAFYLAFRVSGIISIKAGSPGECLLDKKNIRQAYDLGKKLSQGLNRPAGQGAIFQDGQEGIICPGCHNLTFCLAQKKIVCPVCKEEGIISGNKILWKNKSKFGSLKMVMDNSFKLMQESHISFKKNIRSIVEAKEKYRDNRINISIVRREKSS
ncbi:MAG: flavodoxin family protein [Proteobacteria bacterium]|nr:flavodoxin family protein [Pseudomonadota bacterium]